MEIAAKYIPVEVEGKWYKYWLDNEFFHSEPDDREPYTIVIPPPNVTGVLHMGHMLNNTIQDVLVRRARMKGLNACWVPGTDHASIATEAKVVEKLRKEGINKNDLTRDTFLKHAWEWKEKHGGIILEQLKKLGASCDWDRTRFTMDENYSESVIKVFIDLYNKGLIYRGVRMVNWDPKAKTAISDEEVNYQEVKSKLYYIRYLIHGTTDAYVTIATTRPETILGDTAVCINPNDQRYLHLKGKQVIIPLINRVVPIIMDEYVEVDFGTGCLKVTPAHDINDYELGIKYNLESIDIFNDDGTLNEKAQLYVGKDRFVVREEIVKELSDKGHIVKIEDYINKVGYSERSNEVIEPKLSLQWFLKMEEISKPALEAVVSDAVNLIPPKFKNTYKHWMENVKDWCISRQLWWGHRIPAWYINDTHEFVVAATLDEALALAKEKTGNSTLTASGLKQDDDVLDTWFSSWLWPISVFDGLIDPDNKDINYYYPTNDLVTAPEILFFWVARMIIAGFEYKGKKPFTNVYLTGIVRDDKGRKMSKSLGNSPDPLDLIEKYGADSVRVGMLLTSPAGNDLLYDDELNIQGRNFGNKIWNAFRLVSGWTVSETGLQPEATKVAIAWFDAKLNQTIGILDKLFEEFRLSEALMTVYKLFWDEFSSWYLESIKPAYQAPIDIVTFNATLGFFDKLLKLLHPFMPFITEELWQVMHARKAGESIMIEMLPKAADYNPELLEKFEYAKEVIGKIRQIRQDKNIPQKNSLDCFARGTDPEYDSRFIPVIIKHCNLSDFNFTQLKVENALSFIVKNTEYFIPLHEEINVDEEITKLEEELAYTIGFLDSVNKKLENERFVQSAPVTVVEKERAKQTDAQQKIEALKQQITTLKS